MQSKESDLTGISRSGGSNEKDVFNLYVAQNMEFLAQELNFELWRVGPALCIYRYLHLDNKISERFLSLGSLFKLIFLRKRFLYGDRNSNIFRLGISFALVPLRCLWHKQVSCLSILATNVGTSCPVHPLIFYHKTFNLNIGPV